MLVPNHHPHYHPSTPTELPAPTNGSKKLDSTNFYGPKTIPHSTQKCPPPTPTLSNSCNTSSQLTLPTAPPPSRPSTTPGCQSSTHLRTCTRHFTTCTATASSPWSSSPRRSYRILKSRSGTCMVARRPAACLALKHSRRRLLGGAMWSCSSRRRLGG